MVAATSQILAEEGTPAKLVNSSLAGPTLRAATGTMRRRRHSGSYRRVISGDLGYQDADGYFFLVGRRHETIKVGSHRVGAREIEDVLHLHPAVAEAAVLAAPHHLLGEVPVAFVALQSPFADACDALRGFCALRLAVHKVPARVVELPTLPKLQASGKVDRALLRRLASEMRLDVGSPSSRAGSAR